MSFNFIPNTTKNSQYLCFSSGCLRRIFETQVQTLFYIAQKDRTDFFGVITNCDNVIEIFSDELVDGLGLILGYIDPDFAHHFDCVGID